MNERSPHPSSMFWCLAGGIAGVGLGLLACLAGALVVAVPVFILAAVVSAKV